MIFDCGQVSVWFDMIWHRQPPWLIRIHEHSHFLVCDMGNTGRVLHGCAVELWQWEWFRMVRRIVVKLSLLDLYDRGLVAMWDLLFNKAPCPWLDACMPFARQLVDVYNQDHALTRADRMELGEDGFLRSSPKIKGKGLFGRSLTRHVPVKWQAL